MEEKVKLDELTSEGYILQQGQIAENQVEQLRTRERLAKRKARSKVFEAMKKKGFGTNHSGIIKGFKMGGV